MFFGMRLARCITGKLLHISLKRQWQFSTLVRPTIFLEDNTFGEARFWSNLLKMKTQQIEGPHQQSVRFYAKTKDRQKGGKAQKKKIQINEEVLIEVINPSAMNDQMQAAIEKLKDDFIKNLSLRSTSGSIETLPVTFEGKDYILQDLAQIVRKNPKTVVVNLSSFPQTIPSVLQAISKSGMNLSPQQDGTTLFIPIPKVTKEHRETLSKNAKSLFIKCRDSIKDVQNKFIKTAKNKEKSGLSQDITHQITEYITSTANEHVSSAEKILEAKQQELLKES